MKVIKAGGEYKVYNNHVETYDLLPAQVYSVEFDQRSGFSLVEHDEIKVNEKIYGKHQKKVEKIMSSFEDFNRNMGVILSGDKGIGKSLVAKLLCIKAITHDYPVILVDQYIDGIASFLESIQQTVVVFFDEYDKTFGYQKQNDVDPQAELLTLFDGMAMGKKLFVITCNNLHNINEFLTNRPGRFHYHLRFPYPEAEEIREYLEDKLEEKYYGEIIKVIDFSKKVNLNYDCLRAIAFELNRGETFKEAIEDLNILNLNDARYIVTIRFNNNVTDTGEFNIDLFSSEEKDLYFYYSEKTNPESECGDFYVNINPKDIEYNTHSNTLFIATENVGVEITDEDLKKYFKEHNIKLQSISIKRKEDRALRYMV